MTRSTSDVSMTADVSPLLARRTFLHGLNLSVGGLALGFFPSGLAEAAAKRGGFVDPRAEMNTAGLHPSVFLHLAETGVLTLVCHRSEMGQGIRSTLPVLIAEELGADMARVRLLQADGDKVYGDQNTDGSKSIRGFFDELRRVGATPRTMLVNAAAKRWKVEASTCDAVNHSVVHVPTGRRFGFGELVKDVAKAPIPPPEAVVLRPFSSLQRLHDEKVPLPLLDGPAYVTGTATFGADVKLPGMLIAVIARPPVVGGRVKKWDATRARQVPGVQAIIELPSPEKPYHFKPWGGVAVLASNTWAAIQGRAALELEWEGGENAVYDSARYREALSASVAKPGTVLRKAGDAESALHVAVRRVEAEYHVPHLPHESMEPPVALARVEKDRCEVWAPTQHPQAARTEAARVLGLPEEKVTVHVTFLGGGFGRKSKADFVSEACFLAREAKVPVRVQWTREDDVRHDFYNSVNTQRFTAGIDAAGNVSAWRHRTAFPPIASLFNGTANRPGEGELQQGVLDQALSVPNVSAEGCEATALTRIGWLRSVYNIFHAFGTNCFMDELAHALGKDPKVMMLELLGPPRVATLKELGIEKLPNYGASLEKYPVDVARLRHVIERVTALSRWENRGNEKRTLGLAAHRSFLTYSAAVVSVVQDAKGNVEVDEAWLVADTGTKVNLDRVRSQMEGSIVFGLGLALHGGITMKSGAVEQSNFHDAPIARIHDIPWKLQVELVPSEKPPSGVGEPGVPPVAPALANAIFALTGKRFRELPLRPALARYSSEIRANRKGG